MLKIKDIMTKTVVTVKRDMIVQDVCNVLIEHKISGVPVVDEDNNLIGFISERDIIGSVRLKGFLQKKVEDMMTRDVLSVDEEMSTDQIARIFTETTYRYLPVIRTNKVVGIISRKDVIERMLAQYY